MHDSSSSSRTHSFTRRSFLGVAGAAAATLALPGMAQNTYPNRPLRWIVPYNAGGGTDLAVRILAEPLSKALGQSIIVENRPGAATTVGVQALANSPADGYTMATADNSALYNNWHLFDKLPYSEDSFEYVAMAGRFPLVLVVHRDVPANNFEEWVEWVKKSEHPVNYATPGVGSPHHIAIATIADRLDLQMENIPYKGDSAAVIDVVSGVVPTMIVGVANARQYADDERLRMLAVMWPTRLSTLPNVPTFTEAGLPDFEAAAEQGILMPAGTPKEVVQRINRELATIVQQQEVADKLEAMGMYPVVQTPEEFQEHVKRQTEAFGGVIRRQGITLG